MTNKEALKLIEGNESIKSWLSEFSKEATRLTYASRMASFLDANNLTVKSFSEMDVKDIKKLVLQYQAEAAKQGVSNNGILGTITAVRSYLIGIDKPLSFRKGQLLNLEADTSSHVFTNGDLKKLFEVGNTFEKALLATAVSEGWEISSFLEQEREVIEQRLAHAAQNNQSFIFFMNTRHKTGVSRLCVLNPLAIEWLTKYLATRKDKDSLLFPITQDGVQKMLYRLAEISGLKTTGSLRFHNIRKWLMSKLSRANFNMFQIKYLMGKAIGVSDSTYLQTLQTEIEEKYPLIYEEHLNIYFQGNLEATKAQAKNIEALKKEIQTLKNNMEDVKKQNLVSKLTLDVLLSELANHGIKIKDVSKMLEESYERNLEYEEEENKKTNEQQRHTQI